MLSSKNKKILGCVIVIAVILCAGIYLHNCRVHLSWPDDDAALTLNELSPVNEAGETNYVVRSYWIWQDGSLNCPFQTAEIRDTSTGKEIEGSFAMVCEFPAIHGSTPSVDFGSLNEIESKYENTLLSVDEFVSHGETEGASVLVFVPLDEYRDPERQMELRLNYSVLGMIQKNVTVEIA